MKAGTRVGPYEIVDRIGAGGMGEVHLARDTKLGRDVALKILPRAFTTDPERLSRFEREARLLATLNHPNIAAIYGLESVPADSAAGAASPAIVMELVAGTTLDEYMATLPSSGPGRIRTALDVARQIADALDAAHERGVVHRDIKPANVKITGDGVVKVLDFGLAKSQVDAASSDLANSPTITVEGTRDGVVLGTATYMSPEQARGRAVDKRTDIWSFGCVLYEMLAGTRPFAGETTSDVIAKILETTPDMARLPAELSPGVKRLLQRCLEKDVRRRLRDIADARADIEDELAGRTITTAAGHAQSPRLSPARAATAGALLIGGSAIGWMAANRTNDVAAPLFDRVARVVSTAAHEYGAVISPDGKWIAYLSNAGGSTNVWVKFLAGGDPANLTAGKFGSSKLTVQATDYVSGLAVSPDGSQLAFTVADVPSRSAAWVIPAPLGGEPRKLLQEGNYGMQWSPNGERIVFVRAGGPLGDALVVADPDGQNESVLVKRAGAQHIHWPRWSGDGKYIYFNHGPQNFNIEPTEVFRVAASGGAIERVIATARRAAFPFPSGDGAGLVYAANPDTVDLNLWWRDLRSGLDTRLTSGIGEYTHPVLSTDGRMLIGTVLDSQQSLQRVAVEVDKPQFEPITDGHSGDFDPWSTLDGQRLVFSSSRTGNRNLWIARGAGPPAPLTSGRNFDERPAVSPDGREIAFVSDRGGRRGIWLMSAEGGTPRLIINADVVDTLSWSPDGQQLVYATPNGDAPGLAVVDVATGQATPLKTPKDRATGPTWSRENIIAFIEPRGGDIGAFIQLIRPNGEPVASSPLDAKGAPQIANGSIVWSPDGKRIAASSLSGAGGGSLWIVDPAAAQPYRKLLDLPVGVFTRGITWANDGKSLIVGTYRWTGDIFLAERSAPR